MGTRRITILLDDDLLCELKQAAREAGLTESQLVRAAIERYVRFRSPRRSCYDLAMKSRLIGAATGLPSDLSTSRRHFVGFGRDFQ